MASDARADDGWRRAEEAAQRTVGLHSSGGVGMQAGGSDILGEALLGAHGEGVTLVVSDQGRKPTAGILSSAVSYCNR